MRSASSAGRRGSKASGCSSAQRDRSSACSVADAEPAAEGAALVVARCPHARVVEIDRQPRVRAAQSVVEPARGRGHRRPVQAGLAVGMRLAVDQRADRARLQTPSVHLCEAVAAQHRLGVLVAAVPAVGVVGVDGLVVAEPHQGGPAQVLEGAAPAREAALELAAGVGLAGAALGVSSTARIAKVEWRGAPAGQLERLIAAGRRGRRDAAGCRDLGLSHRVSPSVG